MAKSHSSVKKASFLLRNKMFCASLSGSCDTQKLSAECATFVQLSTSLLNMSLNIKQTDAVRLHQVQLHSTLLPIICSALQPDPVSASSKEESIILPVPQLLLWPGNSSPEMQTRLLKVTQWATSPGISRRMVDFTFLTFQLFLQETYWKSKNKAAPHVSLWTSLPPDNALGLCPPCKG